MNSKATAESTAENTPMPSSTSMRSCVLLTKTCFHVALQPPLEKTDKHQAPAEREQTGGQRDIVKRKTLKAVRQQHEGERSNDRGHLHPNEAIHGVTSKCDDS